MIVDVEATTSVRQAEMTAQRRMIERTQERFGIWPERLERDDMILIHRDGGDFGRVRGARSGAMRDIAPDEQRGNRPESTRPGGVAP